MQVELKNRRRQLHQLSSVINSLTENQHESNIEINHEATQKFSTAVIHAQNLNPWFTEKNIKKSLEGLSHLLQKESIDKWLAGYEEEYSNTKKIGLILAGNLPMVGFHDVLCVLASGNHPTVKLSHQDKLLLPALFDVYNSTFPDDAFDITWLINRKMEGLDAVIATGSNNSSRYFEYYFGKYPHIIRRNRNSVAVLSGKESDEELFKLGEDIFDYFGLGCRNVAKLFVKKDFDLDRFFQSIFEYNPVIQHNKYANNYDYYKALWLMNREDLLDNGFLLLRPSEEFSSPVGSLYYERYETEDELLDKLAKHKEEIQCVVSKNDVAFGNSQKPELWDYADGIDTMEFLLKLK